jgi:hypothetical protein
MMNLERVLDCFDSGVVAAQVSVLKCVEGYAWRGNSYNNMNSLG